MGRRSRRRPVAAGHNAAEALPVQPGCRILLCVYQAFQLVDIWKPPVAVAAQGKAVGVTQRLGPGPRAKTIPILIPHEPRKVVGNGPVEVVSKPRAWPGKSFLEVPVIPCYVAGGLPRFG